MQVERAGGQRHHAGIGPVGDVDIMLQQQAAHGVTQERRMMARQRRHQQHGRLLEGREFLGRQVLLEVEQSTERLLHGHFLDDRDFLPGEGHRDDVKGRFFIFLAQPIDQFVARGDALGERRMCQRGDGVGEQAGRCLGPLDQRAEKRTIHFMDLIKHADLCYSIRIMVDSGEKYRLLQCIIDKSIRNCLNAC